MSSLLLVAPATPPVNALPVNSLAAEAVADVPLLRLLHSADSSRLAEPAEGAAWRAGSPGSRVYQGVSRSGRRVEVYALADGRLECFWSNGEHWAWLDMSTMRAMVERCLARDTFPSLLGY